jgi:L-threonylcarbamoyladenylate synthase
MIFKMSENNHAEAVSRAAEVIKAGGIAACPTETFYCLAAGYDCPDALERIQTLKNRPAEKSFPLIIGSMEQLYLLTQQIPAEAQAFIDQYWPGPLTILFDALPGLCDAVVHEGKVAVRMPGRSFALDLSIKAGLPITATSANISGMSAAQTAEEAEEYFSHKLNIIIDAGTSPGGLTSTIVDITDGRIKVLRQGAVKINI